MKYLLHLLTALLALFLTDRAGAQTLNVCQGDSLRLSTATLNIPGVTGIEWFRDNTLISTDTAFEIKEPGVYTLRCSGTGACLSDFSQPLTVIVQKLTAVNDSSYTQPATAVNIKVLLNDQAYCYPVDTPTLTVTQQAHFGNVIYMGNGTFKYTPHPAYVGLDTFYYVVNDVNGNPSNVARVVISISVNSPLPLIIGDFEAVKAEDEAHLYWNTFSTSNASHFEVQRSADARNFEFKGKVLAPAQSAENTAYNYWDKKPLPGKNYYRLKMVDLGGNFEYSEIRMVNFDNIRPVKVYPIPAGDYITVELGQNQDIVTTIQVMDASGREVIRHPVSSDTETLSLKDLAAGAYYIRFTDKNNALMGEGIKFNKTL